MKKLFLLFFFICIAVNIESKVMEIPFENTEEFYLYRSQKENGKIKIIEGDAFYKQAKRSFFIPFEKNDKQQFRQNIGFFTDKIFGSSSGLFYDSRNFLEFRYEENFYQGLVLEFWLKPFTTDSGTILTTQAISHDGIDRSLQVFFHQGRLMVVFKNLFLDSNAMSKPQTISLSSGKIINAQEWRHHRIVYNATTGEIAYYLDQELITQKWATETGDPNGNLLYLENPSNWNYVIGNGYRGLIDNFFISGDPKNAKELFIYEQNQSFVQTKVINLKELISIYDIELVANMPQKSYLTLQYRASLEPFSNQTPEELVKWYDYNIEKKENPIITARYIQMRIGFYPTPDGKKSPLLSAIRLKYDTIDIPVTPLGVEASSSEGKVFVSFRESTNINIKEYKIYYGKKPGQYWGKESYEGVSPISVKVNHLDRDFIKGKLTFVLRGLDFYQTYYIRVSAVNHEGIESEMSEEVEVRVRKLK